MARKNRVAKKQHSPKNVVWTNWQASLKGNPCGRMAAKFIASPLEQGPVTT
ncbi:MAG: hypothetical protein GAK35_03924 [Herbaspirillum frisingense]|uniref:Uncharacterized protein n=1 Tax=Herbaspirillum frisingense TaxID=92645 RepID=A0A7V8FTB5_9BURK|nr:MAG: hypothetical protein GAK35_03924 [Herbaspirillum frisingense]